MLQPKELPSIPDDTLSGQEIKSIKLSWEKNLISDSKYPQIEPFSQIINTEIFWKQVRDIITDEHPHFERILPSNRHQTVIFAGLFKSIMTNLDNLHNLDEFLMTIGRKHIRIFGIDSSYFQVMGMAFIKSIQIFCYPCKNHWKISEVCKVWGKLFAFLANSMIIHGENDDVLTTDMINDPIHAQSGFVIANSTTGGAAIIKRFTPHMSETQHKLIHRQQQLQYHIKEERERRKAAAIASMKSATKHIPVSSSVRSGGSHPDMKSWVAINSRISPSSPPVIWTETPSTASTTPVSTPESTPVQTQTSNSGSIPKKTPSKSSGSVRSGGKMDARTLIELNTKAALQRKEHEARQQMYLANHHQSRHRRHETKDPGVGLMTPPHTPPSLAAVNYDTSQFSASSSVYNDSIQTQSLMTTSSTSTSRSSFKKFANFLRS